MKKLLFLGISLFFSVSLSASHLLGGQLSAQCNDDPNTSGFEYDISFVIIRDANGVGLGPTQNIEIAPAGGSAMNTTVTQANSITFTIGSRQIEIVWYEGSATLQPNTNYTLSWSSCCRPMGVLNIPNSVGQSMHYWAQINTGSSCNSTPQFVAPPLLVWPNQISWMGSIAAFDFDGDALTYGLDVPYGQAGTPNAGYTMPSSLPGGQPNVDSTNGLFQYVADGPGSYSLVYEITARDANGVVNAIVRRDLYLEVIPIPGSPIKVVPALPINNPHHDWVVGNPDTLVFQAACDGGITASYHVPDFVDVSKIDFWVNQYKFADSADVFFTYRPTMSDIGTEFPVVVRFEGGDLTWDEVFYVGAKTDVGLETLEHGQAYIFPNPAKDKITVAFDSPMSSIRMVDATGRVVAEADLSKVVGEWSSDLQLRAGIYFVNLTDANGVSWTEPLIIQ
ncbi:MAG: T9SS type A sorting domain-containing protein [Bacteroidetes bacterium]|nr:MAG: T9SS type A sorting domain-containing protein [Bacteroidota bacterium]